MLPVCILNALSAHFLISYWKNINRLPRPLIFLKLCTSWHCRIPPNRGCENSISIRGRGFFTITQNQIAHSWPWHNSIYNGLRPTAAEMSYPSIWAIYTSASRAWTEKAWRLGTRPRPGEDWPSTTHNAKAITQSLRRGIWLSMAEYSHGHNSHEATFLD